MTPERAKDVIKAASVFPFWGNYRRFMTAAEIDLVETLWQNHPSGSVSFASIVSIIARAETGSATLSAFYFSLQDFGFFLPLRQ